MRSQSNWFRKISAGWLVDNCDSDPVSFYFCCMIQQNTSLSTLAPVQKSHLLAMACNCAKLCNLRSWPFQPNCLLSCSHLGGISSILFLEIKSCSTMQLGPNKSNHTQKKHTCAARGCAFSACSMWYLTCGLRQEEDQESNRFGNLPKPVPWFSCT